MSRRTGKEEPQRTLFAFSDVLRFRADRPAPSLLGGSHDWHDVAVLSRLATALLQTAESAARLSEAEAWIERALTLAPGQPALLALRGRIRACQQKDAAAVSDLEAAIREDAVEFGIQQPLSQRGIDAKIKTS